MSNFIELLNNDGVYDLGELLVKKSSPDTAALNQIDDLTNHATYLYHTNPYAHGLVETASLSVVRTGLKLQSQINYKYLGISQEEALEKQQQIEGLFNMVADSTELDAMGISDFKKLQEIVYRTAKITGGAVVLYPRVKQASFRQKIKIIESSHLRNKDNVPDTEKLAGGIELYSSGGIKKYHLLKYHPNGNSNKEEWITVTPFSGAKQNISHVYDQKRAGQRRGVPFISAVLDVIRKLKDYSDAELDAALLNARFAGFVYNDNPPMHEDEEDGETPTIKIKKGNMVQLNQGWKVNFADPARPNVNFSGFQEALVKEMCMATQIPFEMFMKLFRASYSASRGAVVEGKKFIFSERHDLAAAFCQPTFANVMLEFVLRGDIDLPGFLTDPMARIAWLGSTWVGDVQEEIDPIKAAKAAKIRIEEGLSTRDREAKELNGSDFARNVEVGKDETKKLEESGLPYIGSKKDG